MCIALFKWFARTALLDGIVKTATAKYAKHLVSWNWSVSKCARTQM